MWSSLPILPLSASSSGCRSVFEAGEALRRGHAAFAKLAGQGRNVVPVAGLARSEEEDRHRKAAFAQGKKIRANVMALKAGNGATVQSRRANQEDMIALLDKVNCFIFDCDGVIWRGDILIDEVPDTLEFLRSLGKRLVFVTNNSTKSRAGYVKKFTNLGLNVQADEIFSSSFAAAAYLESINFDKRKKIYVIGEVGIEEELELKGFNFFGGPEDGKKEVVLSKGFRLPHDPEVGAVVVGFDRNINYYKLQYATLCIRENPGCLFIATNTDSVTHLTDAQEWAGGGAMVGAIKGSTKKEPIVVGKPADFMLQSISNQYRLKRDQICMVGDRLDTDILFGKDGGLTTCLVLTGVTQESTLLSPQNSIHPDYYMSCLPELLKVKDKISSVV